MQKIQINSWLNVKNSTTGLIQNANNEIKLDFSNVEEIGLKDIEKLLDLQKIAVFNETKLSVENMKPSITKLFQQTGLCKVLDFGNNQHTKTRKRQGLAFD